MDYRLSRLNRKEGYANFGRKNRHLTHFKNENKENVSEII